MGLPTRSDNRPNGIANIENSKVEIAPSVPIKDALKDKEVEKKAVLVMIVPKQKSITKAGKYGISLRISYTYISSKKRLKPSG